MKRSIYILQIILVIIQLISSGCSSTIAGTASQAIETVSLDMSTSTPPSTSLPVESADIIFYNGSFITMDPEMPQAQALAVRGNLIAALGGTEEVFALQGEDTVIVDLQGSTLMPGFVDPHTHLFNDASRFLGSNNYQQAQQLALRNGITTVADLFVDPGFLAAMQATESSGQLRVRTSLYLAYTTPCGELMGDWYTQFPPTRTPGEMLRIGGLKIYADGGVCGSWALSYELPGLGYGNLWFTQEEMNTMVQSLDAAGYQLAIHALGDRAIEQVLNAYETILDGQPNTLRHRIEHNATLRPDLIPRYSETGVVALIFGAYPVWMANASPHPYENHNDWEWPYRDLMQANPGLHIAWHGDYPWVGPVSPLLHLYSMVTPYSILWDDGAQSADPDYWTGRTFTVEEVLPMMTIEGAYALFRDEEVGSLETDKYADLIVLSGNPITINPLEIKDLEVWMTMVGGNVEWCAPGHEALCPSTPLPPAVTVPTPLSVFQDDFSGTLQPGWTWIGGNDALWNLTSQPGYLRMELESGFQPPDLLVRDVGSDNFQVTTHLLFSPESNYQFAGLIIYQDDETKVQLGRAYCNRQNGCVGNGIYFDAREDSQPRTETFATKTQLKDEAYLRIDKTGSLLSGYYSEDGTHWSMIGKHEILLTNPRVGLNAGQSMVTGAVALFDYFSLVELP